MFEPIEVLIPVVTIILIALVLWERTRKYICGVMAVGLLIYGLCAMQNAACAEKYDIDAEVISIIYVDDIVKFNDGTDCFAFEGGAKEHRLGDLLHVVMDNMDSPTRRDDMIVYSEHIGETLRVERYYIVAANGVAWGAFVFQVDAEEFVKELKTEGITAALIRVG